MFFDTEKFIQEVHSRECLWNNGLDIYTDKSAKRFAWEEIATSIYKNWDRLEPQEQDEKINDLGKKWRNLRDNYKREKRKDFCTTGENPAIKKRKYIYSDMLSFLDTTVQNTRHLKNGIDHQNDSKDLSSTPDFDSNNLLQIDLEEVDVLEEERVIPSELSETNIIQLQNHSVPSPRYTEDLKTAASRDFLLSLLPDVLELDDRQRMRFRLGVLNLINDIRFSDANNTGA